jgi:hypothetical protein
MWQPGGCSIRYLCNLTSATLVRKSAGALDRFEGVAEFVGEGVGDDDDDDDDGDDDVRAGLDLDGSVAAGCSYEFAY